MIDRIAGTLLPAAILLFFAGTLAGCGGDGAAPGSRLIDFATAERATAPVLIEGSLEQSSLRRDSGKPIEFTLREESSARKMAVLAPEGVTVPSNITSSSYVTVTGTYDAAQRKLVASSIRTRVPNRDQQH